MKKTVLLVILLAFLPFVLSNVLQTTMTWFVPSSKSHSISFPGSCSQNAFFFVETNAVIDNDLDGNANQILPYTNRSGGTACQSSSVAGMLVTNSGNIAANIDANFVAALDTNVWLKVWMGTGNGCGTSGFGGWERTCTLLGAAIPVTDIACKDFNIDNATTITRLVTALPVGDTNQLCFSGEFMGANYATTPAAVTANTDHNGVFQTFTS